MRSRQGFGRVVLRVIHRAVGVVEQAQSELQAQDIAHASVYLLHAHPTLFHKALQVPRIAVPLHVHLHLCVHAEHGRFAQVLAVAVSNHVRRRRPVAHEHAVVAPFVAQDVHIEMSVRRRRHTVQVVEGAHDSRAAGINRRFEGRQIDLAEQYLGNPSGVVVASALAGGVAGEMLHAGSKVYLPLACRGVVVFALVTTHGGSPHNSSEVGVLAIALCNASPARVACHVHHRREGPAQARLLCLLRRQVRSLLHQCGVESGCLTERNRIDSAETVNHIARENHRDTQSGLLHGNTLVVVRLRAQTVEHRACPLPYLVGKVIGIPSAAYLRHLSDFLLKRHLSEQGVNLRLRGVLRGACCKRRHCQKNDK